MARSSGWSVGRVLSYGVLLVFTLVSLFPFYWMFVTGSNTTRDAIASPPRFLPGAHFVENSQTVLNRLDFAQALLNSLLVSSTVATSVMLLSGLAGFAFAKFEFSGRNMLFLVVIFTMLLPTELAVVPRYLMMSEIGWVDSLRAVIVPALVSAFGTFWMRQAIKQTVRSDILDAARIDGCGFVRQFWHVVLPTTRPSLAALGLLAFIGSWNEFLWPAVVLQSPENQTIQVAMQRLTSQHGTDFAVVLTGTSLAVIPLLVAYVLFARQFVDGLTEGSLVD